MICFQISIFEPLNTACFFGLPSGKWLWFAFKLVSLSHWIQHRIAFALLTGVVICFQISIFEPLNTAARHLINHLRMLWFAFKLVSLSHWIQRMEVCLQSALVVICFQISIFEPLNTALLCRTIYDYELWFAFKLVSLSHWIQPKTNISSSALCCDLLSN